MSAYDESYECLVDAVTVGDGLLGSAAPRIKTTDFQDLRFRKLGERRCLTTWPTQSLARVFILSLSARLAATFLCSPVPVVIKRGTNPEMIGAHAWRIIAGMEDKQAIRDGAEVKFPRETMCPDIATGHREQSVAVFVTKGLPFPASVSLGDSLPKPNNRWRIIDKDSVWTAVVAKSLVVHFTHAALLSSAVCAAFNGTVRIIKHLGIVLRGVMRTAVQAARPLSIVTERAR